MVPIKPPYTCATCGGQHARPYSRYCGAPCSPIIHTLVGLVREKPRSWTELWEAISAPPHRYKTSKTRVIQGLMPLVKQGLLRTCQATDASPTVVYAPPMAAQAGEHARALDMQRRASIGHSSHVDPRHPGARAKRQQAKLADQPRP